MLLIMAYSPADQGTTIKLVLYARYSSKQYGRCQTNIITVNCKEPVAYKEKSTCSQSNASVASDQILKFVDDTW